MGVKCNLVENQKPRAYYNDQQGMGVAPFVLQIPDAKYDIGLYADGSGGYEARTDFFGGSVSAQLGVQACSVDSKDQAQLGKLFQAYGIQAAMEQARKAGHQVRRVAAADGAVKLIVTGM